MGPYSTTIIALLSNLVSHKSGMFQLTYPEAGRDTRRAFGSEGLGLAAHSLLSVINQPSSNLSDGK